MSTSPSGVCSLIVYFDRRERSASSRQALVSDRERRPLLLVEDDPDIRAAIAEILQEEGFAVVTASNGREGLARLVQMARPCLILLDMNMPVMDGPEFMARIREEPGLRACTVLLVTATQTAPPSGADGYLLKPFDIEELLGAVERYCPYHQA